MGDLRENLVQIAREIIRLAQQILPRTMVGWGSGPDQSAFGPGLSDAEGSPMIRHHRRLARYLRQEVERGRLRPCDGEAVARLLFGPCLSVVRSRACCSARASAS